MAALLVAMSIMAVMLTVAMPVWKQMTQREREEELVFRGMQYAHAIGMFQRKYANAYPPNLDVLVNEHFLRKKFKDPVTNDDFIPIIAGQNTGIGVGTAGASATPGAMPTAGATAGGRGAAAGGRGATTAPQPGGFGGAPGAGAPGGVPAAGAPGGASGGIMGVTSKSRDKSIRVYNGRNHYNEWQFVWVAQVAAPGAGGAPGAPVPGQRGGVPGQPGPGGFGGGRGTTPGRGTGPGGPGTGRPGGFGPGTSPFQPQPPIGSPRGRSGR